MTQKEHVLKYLQEHKSLTSMEAFKQIGCTRLAAVVFDLKEMGYPIKTNIVTVTNKDGEKKNIAEYTLESD